MNSSLKTAAGGARELITFEQLQWTAVCLGLAVLAELASLPVWIAATVGGVAALRLFLAARGRGMPPRAVRATIAVAAIGLLFLQFHTFNGLAAGTALLSLIAGLKLLETRTRRDLYVVPLIIYFLCLAALLQHESFWLLAYLLGVCWLTTATLLRVSRSSGGGPIGARRNELRWTGRIIAQALPLALALWLFFPRLGSPLWQTPSSAGQSATSGLGDTLSPGDITELALSDEVAFRVHFDGAPPPRAERYFRGPVLHDFDGHSWRHIGSGEPAAASLEFEGQAYRYRISIEPHEHNWLYVLDWPSQWDTPHAALTSDYVLLQAAPVSQPIDVAATSYTHLMSAGPLPSSSREQDTRLPRNRNPRTLQLAYKMRSEHPDEKDYIRAVLDMFRQQPYFYTLTPPALTGDTVDGFLFDTKRGFCGHYASAFAVLMRAAGIPARIVTGYFGGTYNRFADYWILRQSDAHAWVEIWTDGIGWRRVDPTAVIDAQRVDRSLSDGSSEFAADPSRWSGRTSWLTDARLRLDAMRVLWRDRILRYNPGAQEKLLETLHVPQPDGQKLAWLLAASLLLALSWLTWQVRRDLSPRPQDPAIRAYRRMCLRMASIDLPRDPHEGAEAYAARVAAARPDLAPLIEGLCRRYTQLRYGTLASKSATAAFIAAVRSFRPKARKPAKF